MSQPFSFDQLNKGPNAFNDFLISRIPRSSFEAVDIVDFPSVIFDMKCHFNLFKNNVYFPIMTTSTSNPDELLDKVLQKYTLELNDSSRESRVIAKRIELQEKMNKSPLRHRKLGNKNMMSHMPTESVIYRYPSKASTTQSVSSKGCQTYSSLTSPFMVSVSTQTDISSFEMKTDSVIIHSNNTQQHNNSPEVVMKSKQFSSSSTTTNISTMNSKSIKKQIPNLQISEVFWEIDFQDINSIHDSDPFIFAGYRWRLTFGRYNETGFGIMITLAQRDNAIISCEFKIHSDSRPTYSMKSNSNYHFSANTTVYKGFREFIGTDLLSYINNGKLKLSVVMSTEIGKSNDLIGISNYNDDDDDLDSNSVQLTRRFSTNF
eukprot:gene6943-14098_t